MDYKEIIHFWFYELTPRQWFMKDNGTDQIIQHRFEACLNRAIVGELYEWRTHALGRLAEILVLDQFSRNIHRNSPRAFAADPLALILAQEMVQRGDDQKLDTAQKAFAYMPYMHSESGLIHREAIRLFSLPGLEDNLDFEKQHKAIIDQFGRYPHRNQILGRISTPEEINFLKTHKGF